MFIHMYVVYTYVFMNVYVCMHDKCILYMYIVFMFVCMYTYMYIFNVCMYKYMNRVKKLLNSIHISYIFAKRRFWPRAGRQQPGARMPTFFQVWYTYIYTYIFILTHITNSI